jgi:alkylated DNA repair dioxygenase AlkB
MPDDTDALERALAADLATLGDRLAEERFGSELYRALTNTRWYRDGLDGHLALSWNLAEGLVNDLRRSVDQEPLALAQTGGEGEVAPAVESELRGLGWTHKPLDTHRHDDDHVSEEQESPPPSGPPAGHLSEEDRFRAAHEEAEANRTS